MTADYCCGSSPHAWGIHPGRQPPPHALRFIPTCVGNTQARALSASISSVHPHMRGEYDGQRNAPCVAAGSSPRAWGIRPLALHLELRRRFIPTCVGNTNPWACMAPRLTVHPHVRGEYTSKGAVGLDLFGSSPRAWGILRTGDMEGASPRFIPTCVGNTPGRGAHIPRVPVHPHVRGEYDVLACFAYIAPGSSPRAWGIPRPMPCAGYQRRFIPTCVGNTSIARRSFHNWTVHPHVRGEYNPLFREVRQTSGSSPRAWGIRQSYIVFDYIIRFIPTCVGNTQPPYNDTVFCTVHPHVRGEYAAAV